MPGQVGVGARAVNGRWEKAGVKKAIIIALSAALLISSCTITTPGPTTVGELMAPFVYQFGPLTGKGLTLPVQFPEPSNPNVAQIWTWYPVEITKTPTITATYWTADFSDNYAWKVVDRIRK